MNILAEEISAIEIDAHMPCIHFQLKYYYGSYLATPDSRLEEVSSPCSSSYVCKQDQYLRLLSWQVEVPRWTDRAILCDCQFSTVLRKAQRALYCSMESTAWNMATFLDSEIDDREKRNGEFACARFEPESFLYFSTRPGKRSLGHLCHPHSDPYLLTLTTKQQVNPHNTFVRLFSIVTAPIRCEEYILRYPAAFASILHPHLATEHRVRNLFSRIGRTQSVGNGIVRSTFPFIPIDLEGLVSNDP